MAVNEVIINGEKVVDLTDTTATEETVVEGVEFYDASGIKRTGSAIIPKNLSQLKDDVGYAKQSEVDNLSEEIVDLQTDVESLSLGMGEDGRVYLLRNGVVQGNGIELPTGGASGDVIGNIGENNIIMLNGDIADGTYTVKYEMENGTVINIGNMVLDSNVYHSITNKLTNCTNGNSATKVIEGNSYNATITANSGYKLSSVTVTMGGTNITSSSVSGGTINIANVNGAIVITATAVEDVPTYTNLFKPANATLNQRINSSFVLRETAGHVVTEFINVSGNVPFTSNSKIYIKGANFGATTDGSNYTRIFTYKTASATAYTGGYSQINGSNLVVKDEGNGVISVSGADNSTLVSSFASGVQRMVLVLRVKDTTITASDIQNVVVTINEPI